MKASAKTSLASRIQVIIYVFKYLTIIISVFSSECADFIGAMCSERSLAASPELSPVGQVAQRPGEGPGEDHEAPPRLQTVAHHGPHPRLSHRNTPEVHEGQKNQIVPMLFIEFCFVKAGFSISIIYQAEIESAFLSWQAASLLRSTHNFVESYTARTKLQWDESSQSYVKFGQALDCGVKECQESWFFFANFETLHTTNHLFNYASSTESIQNGNSQKTFSVLKTL